LIFLSVPAKTKGGYYFNQIVFVIVYRPSEQPMKRKRGKEQSIFSKFSSDLRTFTPDMALNFDY